MTKEIYKNNWMRVVEENVFLDDGTSRVFGITELSDGVTVLCLDEDNNILLVEEFRAALKEKSLELISGGIEKNEDIIGAARRELEEETGFIANDIQIIGKINPFTSIVRSINYILLAKKLSSGRKKWDDGEILKLHRVTPFEALNMIKSNKITHGASCFAIVLAHQLGLIK